MSRSARTLLAAIIVVACSNLPAQSPSPGLQILNEYGIRANLAYHRADGEDLELDLYLPRGSEEPVPVLVYYHGGGWVLGSRQASSLNLLPYLEQGFAVANVSYRLADSAPAPAAVIDAVCALRWVAANADRFGLDAERIVVSGHSAGGHLALMAGLVPSDSSFALECASLPEIFDNAVRQVRPASIVNWYGITDVADLLDGENRQLYAQQWIGAQPNGAEIARMVSPLRYVSDDGVPTISIHGDADRIVPYSHATRLHDALESAGTPNRLITVPEGAHGGFSLDQDNRHFSYIWAFLREHDVLR